MNRALRLSRRLRVVFPNEEYIEEILENWRLGIEPSDYELNLIRELLTVSTNRRVMTHPQTRELIIYDIKPRKTRNYDLNKIKQKRLNKLTSE